MGTGFVDWMLGHALYAGLTATLIFCGMGLPFPEEAIFIAAGLYGLKTGASIYGLCIAGLIGIMIGDSIPFFVGRHYGMPFLTRSWVSKLVKPHHIEKTRRFFEHRGSMAIVIARFLAGLRMPTFFMAGAMGLSFLTFFVCDLIGALVSCPTTIAFVYWAGDTEVGKATIDNGLRYGHYVIFGLIGVAAAYFMFRWWRHSRKNPPGHPPESPMIADTASTAKDQPGELRAEAMEPVEGPNVK